MKRNIRYWSRGKLLSTPMTRRWTPEQVKEGERQEKMRIFQGQKLVAVVQDLHPDYAFNVALIEAAPRLLYLVESGLSPEALKELISNLVKLRDNETESQTTLPAPDDLRFPEHPFFL